MLHALATVALCIFIGERLWHYRALRRAAQIILISGVAGMVLLFGLNMLRSELRSSAIRQEAAAARAASPIPYNCPPSTHPGEGISEGQKDMEAYDCWYLPGVVNH